jgi:cellulose synthase/poly-beta-1,6-N-acetylglucosamine synthase-like glycosyltransferase
LSALPGLAWGILAATALILALLLPFAGHRLHLLRTVARRPGPPPPTLGSTGAVGPLPVVTVQLPIYNEAAVVHRLLDAVAKLDYPADRLEIQVLDDSTDDSGREVAMRIEALRGQGVWVEHLTRPSREGYKAGALRWGLERARGEYFLILDADFVPPPDLITRFLPSFEDPEVGMVQGRWDHLNEDAGWLTRCQALMLDAHFFFEQGGRFVSGSFLNFNGTAGMWRRAAILGGGGWSADTLTEDLDLSYRAQMAGWRFIFRSDIGVPGELPETPRALELQQKRWAQGGVQTGRKLLRSLWRGPWPLRIKVEGTFHLLGHLGHPLTLALGFLLLPSAVARDVLGFRGFGVWDVAVFTWATLTFLVFYLSAGRFRRRPWRTLIPTALVTLSLGIGLTAAVSRAVLRGLLGGRSDPFHRTPKRGGRPCSPYSTPRAWGDRVLGGVALAWGLGSLALAVHWGYFGSIPFLILFSSGWGWMALAPETARRVAPQGPGS